MWPFKKHVREQILQVQATTLRLWALTHRSVQGRTGPLAVWFPAASRAYFLVQRKESGLLLASPDQPAAFITEASTQYRPGARSLRIANGRKE